MISMFYTGIALTIIFSRMLFKRYFPIWGIPCISYFSDINYDNRVILDTRNYNESIHELVPESIQIPYAYLARYYHEIPDKPIHLIANNTLDRNLSIRFLRAKGFEIKSYSLIQCICK